MVMMLMLLFAFIMTSPRYKHDVSYAMRAVLFDALTQSFTRPRIGSLANVVDRQAVLAVFLLSTPLIL